MSQRVSDEQIKHLLKAVKDGDFLGTYEAKLVLADLEEARAAFVKFGQHRWFCSILASQGADDDDPHCTCGFDEALAAMEEKP